MKHSGKTAIVTGAAGKCLGRSTALTLARDGANVVINYRSGNEAFELVEYIRSQGGRAQAVKADIFIEKDCKRLISSTLEDFGQIDMLIIGPGAGWHAEPIDKLKSDDAMDDMTRETAPLYYLIPPAINDMKKRNWGRIIGISINTRRPSPSISYNVSKSARTSLLRHIADDAWKHRITVNTICPSPVGEIATLQEAIAHVNHGELWQNRKNISPQDMAEGISFLCSDEAGYITGSEINYDF
jgi:NAD(P)-dependent dehydrogenase (short-subunit alcohol dehydrogenase family)